MQNIKKYLGNKEVIIHVLCWIFYFSSVHVHWTDNWFDKSLRPRTPSPVSALLMPVYFYLNAFGLIPRFLKGKDWYRYFLVIFAILVGSELLRSLVFIGAQGVDGSFFEALGQEVMSNDNLIFGIPNSMWFAFALSFAYRFTKDWITNNQLIEQLKTEKITMELNLLKSQINPHFLFNNLNALDDLIDRDQQLAKQYLHKLSKMYRYSIMNMENDVVSLQEEWEFIESYIYLIEERFGSAYQFEKINELNRLDDYLIPPAALQSLLENAVKHNQGSLKEPLLIYIKATEQGISVSHLKRPKLGNVKSLGTGLKNLKARYQLLSDQEITIEDTEKYTVLLPLIKQLS